MTIANVTLLITLFAFFFQTAERTKASEYPAHGRTAAMEVGAEYSGRTVFTAGPPVVLEDHLAVQVAIFPAKGQTIRLTHGDFLLLLNGKKPALLAQPPSFVAAALKYSDWEHRSSLEATAGTGDAGVILGRRRPTERFPGDQRGRTYPVPRAPAPEDRSGVDRTPPDSPADAVAKAALIEGEVSKPVSGYLYFAWRGKTKSLKKAELIYSGPAGEATLSLF